MAIEDERAVISAPISGIIVPITDVPDPTFAQKMVGDGVAIDPTEETLRSPCGGHVSQLHPSCHALTISATDGTEILMHVGLDTVMLKGHGFKALVSEGDTVRRGDPLIAFDADYIAQNATSLLTMIVITNGGADVKALSSGMAVAGATPLLGVSLPPKDGKEAAKDETAPAGIVKSMPVTILNQDGLHARPAAVLSASAKRFSCSIKIGRDGQEANAKSVVGIMGLSVKRHDSIVITAEGDDAAEAIAALVPLIQSGLGENLHVVPGKREDAVSGESPAIKAGPENPDVMVGISASPGLVAGAVFQLRGSAIDVKKEGRGAEEEKKALEGAISGAAKELDEIEKSLRMSADTGKAAIFAAHRELLEDPALFEAAMSGIKRGQSAAYAWRENYAAQADSLAKLNNELLAARAADVRDIGERVLARLTGAERRGISAPENSILIAPDLTPSDTAGLSKSGVLGFCVTGGGATSHASILARAAGMPAVVAAPERVLDLPDGTPAILDGEKGFLRANPSREEIARVRARQEKLERKRRDELAAAALPAATIDGVRIKVVGNISGASEAGRISELGGEGVGLLRSEFLFLQRTEEPSQEEQSEAYAAIAKAIGPKHGMIVRTLDVGGDKPLAYLPLPEEVNPFLGIRGIRLNMLGTGIFSSQVRSILKIAPLTQLGIMFPMVATVEEFRAARDIVLREKDALGIKAPVQIGIMVEVPSAAIMSDVLAQEVDFFSIGTNDLTQYALAMDRRHPKLAGMADALHPAVLRLIHATVEAAHKHGKWAGICGGIASDVSAVPVLIGLGLDELSVSVQGIPSVKAAIRALSMERCMAIARDALDMKTSGEVRSYLAGIASQAPNEEGEIAQ